MPDQEYPYGGDVLWRLMVILFVVMLAWAIGDTEDRVDALEQSATTEQVEK